MKRCFFELNIIYDMLYVSILSAAILYVVMLDVGMMDVLTPLKSAN